MFGPQPRSYEYQLPKKVEQGALRAALTQKLRDGAVTVVDALSGGGGRRRRRRPRCSSGSASTGKALLVDVQPDEKLLAVGAQPRGRARSSEQPRDARAT